MSGWSFVPSVLFAVLSCTFSLAQTSPSPSARTLPVETVACETFGLEVPEDSPTLECGFVAVPEHRAQPSVRTLRLAYLIAKSAQRAPDPYLLLLGGPGESFVGAAPGFLQAAGALTEARDFIMLDPRGVGLSKPALSCYPERRALASEASYTEAGLLEQSAREVAADAVCRTRLEAQGVDVQAYTTPASAADIDDVRRALGYQQFNLLGVSYGTRLALTLMREHPESVRSAVLDSVYPFGATLTRGASYAAGAFSRLAADCAADARCNAAHPDLEAVLDALYAKLSEEPLETEAGALDHEMLVYWLYEALFGAAGDSTVPATLYRLRTGDTKTAAEIVRQVRAELSEEVSPLDNSGVQSALNCADEAAYTARADFARANAAAPRPWREVLGGVLEQQFVVACEAWPAAPADSQAAPASDVPTLLLAGTYDPITPVALAKQAAASLSRGTLVTFGGVGHSVLNRTGACGFTLLLSFAANPTGELDSSCAAEITPMFALE